MVGRWLQAGVAVAGAAGLFVALAAVAHAQTPTRTVRLVLVRGEHTEGCSDGAEIARNVSARLGRDVFADTAAESIEGVVQHDGARWEARLYVRDANGALVGSRSLASESPDCAPLDAAVTLAIALAIDPDAALRSPPPAAVSSTRSTPTAKASAVAATVTPASAPPPVPKSPSAGAPAPAPARPCVQPAPVPPSAPRSETKLASLSARALLASKGLLPAPAGGLALSTDASAWRDLSVSAAMVYFPEVRAPAGNSAFGLTAASVGVCAQPWRTPAVGFEICAKVLLGAIHSVVYKLTPVSPGDQPWVANSLDASIRARLVGPLFAELGGEAIGTWEQYTFQVTGQSPSSFQESRLAAFGFIGLGLSIP